MCHFVSWKETKDKRVYFLTHHQLFETKRGQEYLLTGGSPDDYCGHGTVEWYYRHVDFTGGSDRECTDFSSPANFPPAIARAIKAGQMRGLGIAPALLSNEGWKLYDETVAPARKLHEETVAAAWKLHEETVAAACKLHEETIQGAFWNLFADPDKRNPSWR